MSAKTDFVALFLAELPATYSNALPVRGAIKLLAEAIYDANGTLTPADLSVTLAKMATMATASVLGRITAGEGAPEVLTAANVRTIIGLVTAITGASTDAQLPSAKLLYDQLLLKQPRSTVEIVVDNRVLTAADSGMVFGCGTDAKTFSLPATVAGLKYTFVNTGAAGVNPLNISPVAADGISGTFTLAASVVVDAGVVNKDIINTKGTSQAGDSVTIIGTGVTGVTAWIVVASTGIWAAEA